MQKGLVSILTPCYNTGKLVHRLLDSVLVQDYPSVEMFCIDDGSTDNTKEVIESYISKFSEKGYSLTYIYQENSGQSVAINNGLKLVNGEFLIWPDSDDYYIERTAISQFVHTFSQHPSASVVRCYSKFVKEETLEEISRIEDAPVHHRTDLFDDSVLCTNNFYWGAGNYMIRMVALDESIPHREIYTERSAGQNWQMIMPLLYKRECILINSYLHAILERAASHSRGQFHGYDRVIDKQSAYERTILSTLSRIPRMTEDERKKYVSRVQAKYMDERRKISVAYHKSTEAIRYLALAEVNGIEYSSIDRMISKYCHSRILFIILRIIRKLQMKIYNMSNRKITPH